MSVSSGPVLFALIGALLGAIIGSFLATLVLRWPQGRSVARGRSQCDGCGRALGAIDLVPLLSFAAAGGRCRTCRQPIDPLHPAIELLSALVGAVSLGLAPDAQGLAGAVFGWTLLTLAALDGRHFWLPDRITFPLAFLGLTVATLVTRIPFIDHAIGAALGYGALQLIAISYRRARGREGMGGGDPKLMGAIGAWIGWQALPFVLLGASSVGLLAVLVSRLRGRPIDARTAMPFGTLLAIAAWPLWIAVELFGFLRV